MTQFDRSDDKGTKRIVSDRDVIIATDRDQDGAGDFVVTTGGVERLRMTAAGVGSGFGAATGGSISATGDVTITSDSDANAAGDILFVVGATEVARIPNAGGFLAGNDHNSDYGPDSGTPPATVIPIKFQVLKGTPGVDLGQTHQGGVAWTKYKTRTIDQAAQSWSFGVIMTDAYGAFPGAQTQPVTGNESDALVQGGVVVNAKVVAHSAHGQIQDTAHADSVIHYYSATTQVAVGATVTNRYGFYDEANSGGGSPTNSWTVFGSYTIQTAGRLVIGTASTDATASQAIIFGSSSDSSGSLIVQQGTSQTSAAIVVRDSGGTPRGQWFGATGNLHIGNTATGGGGNGIVSLATTTAPTGTPVAAGGWIFIDPADSDAKVIVRNIGGTAGVTRRLGSSHEQLLMEGLTYKSWAFDPNLGSGGTAPTAGTIYVRAMPLRANQIITNTVWQITTAGSGTAPTSIFTGICDSTGKMVVQSVDSHASAIWTAGSGQAIAPLSGTYTVPADGLYYAVFLQVGSWGTTQLVLGKGVNNTGPGGIGTTVFGTAGTAQTVLPANASSLTIVTTNGINYFAGAS